MIELDAMLRGAAIAISLLLGMAFWRARPNGAVAWTWSFLAVGACAYLLAGDLGQLNWRPLARLVVGALAISTPFSFWLFARLVFDDDFRVRPSHFLWLGVIEIAGVAFFVLRSTAMGWPWIPPAGLAASLGLGFRLPSLALVAHALWVVWRGRRSDLVEARISLRTAVVMSAGVAAAFVLIAAIVYVPLRSRPLAFNLAEAGAFLLMAMVAAIRLLRPLPDFLPAPAGPMLARRPSSAYPAPPIAQAGTSSEDAIALSRLETLMGEGKVWRETGLTIGKLAKQIGLPEYRLRRLVNQRLGFRNFIAFLNEYRLAAAAEQLADRAQARIPILTIALDLGWGSIGPFNRAFRARFGVAPSDYRREHLGTRRIGDHRLPFQEGTRQA